MCTFLAYLRKVYYARQTTKLNAISSRENMRFGPPLIIPKYFKRLTQHEAIKSEGEAEKDDGPVTNRRYFALITFVRTSTMAHGDNASFVMLNRN